MTLNEIQNQPTILEQIHESCFRSYHILDKVLEMIQRGDSTYTIFEVVKFLKEYPVETEFACKKCNEN